uniref:Uncharacterized protein n=1 Tax=Lepeophtheirus salmonis TaxID=72036 RepID=A0A0K2U7U1_LEPSM
MKVSRSFLSGSSLFHSGPQRGTKNTV